MILDAYAAFLSSLGIRFSQTNGFSVWIHDTMISVTASRSGMIRLDSYVGLVDDSLQSTQRLTASLVTAFPEYKIWPEKYSGYYEIEMEKSFPYTDVNTLHEKVVAMVEVMEQGYQIGTDLLGKELFHR